jgi:hypothetical protein
LQPPGQAFQLATRLFTIDVRLIRLGVPRSSCAQNRRSNQIAQAAYLVGAGHQRRGRALRSLPGRQPPGGDRGLGFIDPLGDKKALAPGDFGRLVRFGSTGQARRRQQPLGVDVAFQQFVDRVQIFQRREVASQEARHEVSQLKIHGRKLDVYRQVILRRQQVVFLPQHGANLLELAFANVLDAGLKFARRQPPLGNGLFQGLVDPGVKQLPPELGGDFAGRALQQHVAGRAGD